MPLRSGKQNIAGSATPIAVAAATAPATASRLFFARARGANDEVSTFVRPIMEPGDGGLRGFEVGHGNEGKTPCAASGLVMHDIHFVDRSITRKQIAKIAFRNGKRQIPNK